MEKFNFMLPFMSYTHIDDLEKIALSNNLTIEGDYTNEVLYDERLNDMFASMADFVVGRINNFTVKLDYPVLKLLRGTRGAEKFYNSD